MDAHGNHGIHVMTIANSIIGVSIIAMPYCFKQCGIILSIVMLIISSIISRLSCHFLLKSAIRARLRTFEFLAYHAFGPFGKFVVEIGMIGFLIGTCIAFFVVMGDLGPAIVAQMMGVTTSDTLRSIILIGLALFCVLPLGLLRNVDSLSSICVATIGFYGCLILKIMAESASHIVTGDWYDNVALWRIEGVLQCIPIFSMALFCQTQLFEIYQAIPNASLDKMNALIRSAVNICTCVYIFVGIFGYIAVSDINFTGNILLSLKQSFLTEVIKIGFVLSLAFSFPLIIFPCRASLFSLIYKPSYTSLHDGGAHFIPETKFRSLTILIVLVSLSVGILIPNIELVLGLVGSTIGVSICVLFPATCFICMVKKNTNERILAQIMLFVGIIVMVLGTYANLAAVEQMPANTIILVSPKIENPEVQKIEKAVVVLDIPTTVKVDIPSEKLYTGKNEAVLVDNAKEIRHEPPQPIEPIELPKQPELNENKLDILKESVRPSKESVIKSKEPVIEPKQSAMELKESAIQSIESLMPEKEPVIEAKESVILSKESLMEPKQLEMQPKESLIQQAFKEVRREPPQPVEPEHNLNQIKKESQLEEENRVSDTQLLRGNILNKSTTLSNQVQGKIDSVVVDQVDIEAIQKEDKEIDQQAKDELRDVVKRLDAISELQKQNQAQQKQIVEQQNKILDEMKQRNDLAQQQIVVEKVKQEKLKAVKEIEDIANKFIQRIVENDSKVVSGSQDVSNQDKVRKSTNININQSTPIIDTIKANPGPLPYQLGLNLPNETKKNEGASSNTFIPLPIALNSNVRNNTNITNYNTSTNITKLDTKYTEPQIKVNTLIVVNKTANGEEVLKMNQSVLNETSKQYLQNLTYSKENVQSQVKDNSDLQEIKSMRRDILSEMENSRNKRDISDNANETNVPCEEHISDHKQENNNANILLNNLKLPKHSDKHDDEEKNCDKT